MWEATSRTQLLTVPVPRFTSSLERPSLLVIDYAIDVAGMRIVPASGSTVRVEAACADEVPPLLARPGDSWYRRPGDDEPPVLCVVSGSLGDAEVVALIDQGSAPARGERVRLGSAAVFRKPRGLSFSAAAQLMLPALTACAALQAAGLPPPGSVGAGDRQAKVVVAGSTGRLPGLLSQMLRDAGCAPLVAGRAQDAEAVRARGAEFLDHDDDSFAATCSVDDSSCVHAVLDVLGREEDPELVQEYMDARYVSLAPPALTRLADEGALAALRRRWGARRERRAWLPSEAEPVGATLLPRLEALLRSIDSGIPSLGLG
jgi:hypothetical protein